MSDTIELLDLQNIVLDTKIINPWALVKKFLPKVSLLKILVILHWCKVDRQAAKHYCFAFKG